MSSTYVLPVQTNTGGKEGLWIHGGSLLLPHLSIAASVLFLTQAHHSSVEWSWNPQGCFENSIKQTSECESLHRLRVSGKVAVTCSIFLWLDDPS